MILESKVLFQLFSHKFLLQMIPKVNVQSKWKITERRSFFKFHQVVILYDFKQDMIHEILDPIVDLQIKEK